MTVFVDVDDTLVIYRGGNYAHHYGVLDGRPYEPNYGLIKKLQQFDGTIVVWSGGGKDYARAVARTVLLPASVRCMVATKDPSLVKPGDVVVDDDGRIRLLINHRGAKVYGPHDNWEDEKS
jgi:hypothetical protein